MPRPCWHRSDVLIARAASLARAGEGATLTRIHGDLHLGQMLVSSGDIFIIDFEGEPARPLAQRRAKYQSNARCGRRNSLLRLCRRSDGAKKPGSAGAYGTRTAGALPAGFRLPRDDHLPGFLPRGRFAERQDALLSLFLIEKAAYEIAYEAANRPAWIDVPLHGLARIVAEPKQDGA